MLIKSILATLAGAAVTGGAVYVAQNPEVLEPVKTKMDSVSSDIDNAVPIANPEPAKVLDTDIASVDVAESSLEISVPDNDTVRATRRKKRADRNRSERTQDLPKADRDHIFEKQDEARSGGETLDETPKTLSDGVVIEHDVLPTEDAVRDEAVLEVETMIEPLPVMPQMENDFVDTVMARVKTISAPELRDQAYLDIVDYALMRDDFDGAAKATAALRDTALRDTARNNMAVRHALNGDIDAAFATIDTVENEDLRDYMRLQVIEALVVPERLPQAILPR